MYQIPILGQSVAFYNATEILGSFTNAEELDLPSLEKVRSMVYEEVLEVRKVASLERILRALGYKNNTQLYQEEIQRAFYPTLMRIHNGLASLVLHGKDMEESRLPTLQTLQAVTSHKVEAVKKAHGLRFDSELARMTGLPPTFFYSLNHRTAKYATIESIVEGLNKL
ncbi:hypothetical protein [Enterococcus faecium]|uniref:hypothetical protein n=1 Tax=Enterococcus faecium TaxID=1352 RepID=UPI00338E6ABA